MNMTLLIIVSFILVVIALVWTLVIFRKEEHKMQKYEEEGDTLEDQLKRAEEYESRSLSSDIPLQIFIYGITTILFLVVFFIYLL